MKDIIRIRSGTIPIHFYQFQCVKVQSNNGEQQKQQNTNGEINKDTSNERDREKIPQIQDKLTTITEEFNYYLNERREEQFQQQENETIEEALKRAENMFDRIDQIVQRRKIVKETSKKALELIDELKTQLAIINESCCDDEHYQNDVQNEIVDGMIEMRKQIMEKNVLYHQTKIEQYKNDFEQNRSKLMTKKVESSQEKKAKIQQERERQEKEKQRQERNEKLACMMLSEEEGNQLEQWTGKKCNLILFDSTRDNWTQNTTEFNRKVMGKSQLIFLIEDTNGNKFGYYLNTRVEPNRYNQWVGTNSGTFFFSLKSNGRITQGNGMMKFEIKETKESYCFLDSSNERMIALGGCFGDITIFHANHKTKCSAYQNEDKFNYHGIPHALYGKVHPQTFTPRRFVVIQMM